MRRYRFVIRDAAISAVQALAGWIIYPSNFSLGLVFGLGAIGWALIAYFRTLLLHGGFRDFDHWR
jgi:hypothetical protein